MNRRDFLQNSALSVAAVSAMGLGVNQSVRADAPMPKSGGTLRLGLAGASTSDSYDPGTWGDAFTFVGFAAVYNSLIEIDETGQPIPELAESWHVSDDAKTWTFKLRSGVQFHHGKSLEAADVVASFQHHLGESSKSVIKGLLSSIQTVTAKDKQTVVIALNRPYSEFLYVVADYHLVIMPMKDGKADWQSGHGTGGYKITSFTPGVAMKLTRNPNYWKAGRAHFAQAELVAIADNTARMNALVTGQVDVINRIDTKIINLMKRNADLVLEETKGALHYTFPMLTDSAQFKDNNVRLAMKHAIDRDAIVKKILRGYGSVGNDHPVSPENSYVNRDIAQKNLDPEKVAFYLKKAGLSKLSVSINASDAAFSGAVDAAAIFQDSARKAGIDLTLVRKPADGYWSNVWSKEPLCASFWYSSLTPERVMGLGYAKDSGWNDTHWDHPQFNQLLATVRAENDEAKRRGIYNDMQRIISDEGGAIIPVFASSLAARSNKITHSGTTSPWGELDGLRVIERWWQA